MAAAVVVAAALAFVLLRGSGGSGLSTVAPNSVGVVDPGSDKLVAEVPVGIDPESVTVGEGAVWVANVDDETVTRIDPATRERRTDDRRRRLSERHRRRERNRVGRARRAG